MLTFSHTNAGACSQSQEEIISLPSHVTSISTQHVASLTVSLDRQPNKTGLSGAEPASLEQFSLGAFKGSRRSNSALRALPLPVTEQPQSRSFSPPSPFLSHSSVGTEKRKLHARLSPALQQHQNNIIDTRVAGACYLHTPTPPLRSRSQSPARVPKAGAGMKQQHIFAATKTSSLRSMKMCSDDFNTRVAGACYLHTPTPPLRSRSQSPVRVPKAGACYFHTPTPPLRSRSQSPVRVPKAGAGTCMQQVRLAYTFSLMVTHKI
jgi:hypothetical protein